MRTLTAIGIGAAGASLMVLGATALAQNNRYQRNPLEDFFGIITQEQRNSDLNCSVTRRLDRRGDINWLVMQCRGDGSYRDNRDNRR